MVLKMLGQSVVLVCSSAHADEPEVSDGKVLYLCACASKPEDTGDQVLYLCAPAD